MNQLTIFVLFFGIVASQAIELTDDILDQLANLDPANLPRSTRQYFSRKRRSEKDNSNWCCINGTPAKAIQKTRIKLEIVPVSQLVKTGYTSCGDLGFERCSIYEMKYSTAPKYSVETVKGEQTFECPDEGGKLTCCDGFILVAKNCISKEDVRNGDFVGTMKDLLDAGLIKINK
ncbi:uncharacterized protein LOC141900249 [Tubulanus polymorphus]|uniref:uncharacterized protein LOC141900249 n=1 Tax=Tubulanus polymorphus TaxID=672921 RepID=UPI003DA622FE